MKCKAMQNSLLKAILAVGIVLLAIAVITLAALVRGERLYMMLGSAACILVALVKIIAWCAYDKTM